MENKTSKSFNIFKIEYSWYEGEHEETFLGKYVDCEEFENDLKEARNFAQSIRGKVFEEDFLGKGYSVECLPEYYDQIIWFLKEKKRYIICYFDNSIYYGVDDNSNKTDKVINLTKFEETTTSKEL